MTRIVPRPALAFVIVIALAAALWPTLGCGLLGGDRQDPEPTEEPNIQATIAAALQSVSTREAEAGSVTPTPAPEPTAESTPAPSGAGVDSATGLDVVLSAIGPETRWNDLFDTFMETERACIEGELGKGPLSEILETPVLRQDATEEWEVAIFGCLEQETAADLFSALFVAQMGLEAGLTEEGVACVDELLAETDIAALVAGSREDATPQQAEAAMGFFLGLVNCVPAAMGPGAGATPGGPSSQDQDRLWSFATGAWFGAAPTVVDGVVYVGSDDNNLYALDAATGAVLWIHDTGNPVRSAPTVADRVVYVGSGDDGLYALDAANGAVLWSHDVGAGVPVAPAVSGGVVYTSAFVDGAPRVVALEASSGARIWTSQPPHAPGDEFAPTVAGGTVYVAGVGYGEFYALDAATGEVAWVASVGSYVESAPTVVDGFVYLTVVNEAQALDETTGETLWWYGTEHFPARDFPALVVDGMYYLSPDEFLHAIDAYSGELLWTHPASGPISAAPVVDGGVIFAATENGEIFALDASTGTELWTHSAEGRGLQSLTSADGVLYVESDVGVLMAVNAADGSLIREFQKGYILGVKTYTVRDGVVYLATLPSGVQAYAAPLAR